MLHLAQSERKYTELDKGGSDLETKGNVLDQLEYDFMFRGVCAQLDASVEEVTVGLPAVGCSDDTCKTVI